MKKFEYTRDAHLVASLNVKGKAMDLTLAKGKVYELPEENKYIRTLVARGWLKPVVEEKAKKEKPETAKPNPDETKQ